jgi:hypothetical protein
MPLRRLFVLLLLTPALAWCADAKLPQRVLQIEWRMVERGAPPPIADGPDARTVVVGTTGQFDARPGVTVRTAPRDDPEATVRRLRVLNGERARMVLSQPEALQSVQLFRGPKGDGGVVQTTWIERVNALAVRPRWPGGRSPVMVEIRAEVAGAADAASQAPGEGLQVETTLPLALGEWVPVARTGSVGALAAPGVVSSADVRRSASRELQLRVSAP